MLLIDENLSYKLAERVSNDFKAIAAVSKVSSLGEGASDPKVWEYAKNNNLALLTKDKDFVDFWKRYGPPPKVIRLDIGNSRLQAVEALIRKNKAEILKFLSDTNSGLLLLNG